MIYLINLILGCVFLYIDIYGGNSNSIKWLVSFNCFLYLILIQTNIYAILAGGLAFIADYFLLFTDHYLIGITLFILVQLMYMKILDYHNYLPCFLFVFLIINPLITLALIYLCYSLLNLIHSYKVSRSFFIAILLLLCCDITIGLVFLELVDPIFNLAIWSFYLPSQLCFLHSQTFFQKSIF